MKRYFTKIIVFLLLLIFPFGIYAAYIQSQPAAYGYSIMGTMCHKVELLQQTPAPRLVLAGGSSSPYGTNCAFIAEETGMPCINVGGTVYLGLDFYLSMLKKNMHEGDVIVLAPENIMLRGEELGYHLVWAAAENHANVWQVVPVSYWPGMVMEFFQYAKDKRELLNRPDFTPKKNEYHPDFGPLGDVTLPREPLLEKGYNTEDLVELNAATLNPQVAKKINQFAAHAKKQGVTVLFAFAPLNHLAVTTPVNDWLLLEDALRQQLDIPVLGSIENAIMDGCYFYDSNNHLTTEGALIYSADLAKNIAPYL